MSGDKKETDSGIEIKRLYTATDSFNTPDPDYLANSLIHVVCRQICTVANYGPCANMPDFLLQKKVTADITIYCRRE